MRLISCLFIFLLIHTQLSFSQNIGIGTATPARAKFEVYGAVGNTSAIFGGNGIGISFGLNAPLVGFNSYYNGNNLYINNGTAMVQWLNHITGSMYLAVSMNTGTPNAVVNGLQNAMTIKWNGDVALEAGESNATLFVGNAFGNRGVRLQGTTYHSEINKNGGNTYINGGKNGSDVYINDVSSGSVSFACINGSVGINKSPSSTLDIKQYNGRGLVLVDPGTFHNWEFVTTKNQTDNASDYYVYYNGQYKGNFFYADGSYNPISDERLKKDVQPLQGALSRIMGLTPVRYKMKYGSPGSPCLGFIAQDAEPLFPEIVQRVNEKDNGYPGLDEFYTMNYDGLAPTVISALQEEQQHIRELENRINALKKRIANMKAIMNK